MTTSIAERDFPVESRPRWIKTKSDVVLKKDARRETTVVPAAGDGNFVRQLTCLHRSVMVMLEDTKPASDPHLRLVTFAQAIGVAIELAEIIKLPANAGQANTPSADAAICNLQEITNLAHAALDTGRESQGFLVLEGIGFLLGGKPQATLERAMGLLRLKRKVKAGDELAKALEGMTDHDGMITALLAQLRFEAGDVRWIPLAKQVLAIGLNVEARARCTELLAARFK